MPVFWFPYGIGPHPDDEPRPRDFRDAGGPVEPRRHRATYQELVRNSRGYRARSPKGMLDPNQDAEDPVKR